MVYHSVRGSIDDDDETKNLSRGKRQSNDLNTKLNYMINCKVAVMRH